MGNSLEIRLTPEELEAKAGQFENCDENFRDVVNQMHTLITQLSEEWSGNASESFRQQFEDLRPHFSNTSDLITQIASQLRSIASIYRDTDNNIAQQLG